MADLTTTTNVKEYLGITSSTHDTLIGNLVTRVSREIETYCQRTFNSTAYVLERYQPTDNKIIYVDNYPLISLDRVAVGRRGVIEITHTDTSAASATVSVSTTGITTTILGGASAGSTTDAFGSYATLSALATQITTHTDWTASVPDSSFDNMASTDLIPVGERETLDGAITMDVPDERVSDYQVDFKQGSIYRSSGFRGRWNDIYLDYTGGYATIPGDLEQITIEITAEVFQARTKDGNVKSEKIGDYSYVNKDDATGMKSFVQAHATDLAMWRRPAYA
jgi:hypothetical protein